MFFDRGLYAYFLEDYIIHLFYILDIGYGIVGVIILLLMILTAFLGLCFSLWDKWAFVGCNRDLQIYVLQFLLLGQDIVIWLWGG